MRSPSLILWETPHNGPVAARIAVAGDFLPAGKLAFPAGSGWRDMASLLAGHFEDVATSFVNLESALDVERLPARRLAGIGQIDSAPVASLEYLDAIRSQAVGIANNHSYDFGHAGIERTRRAISRHRMNPMGAARDLRSIPEVFVWHGPGDIRVGFWAAAKAAVDLATRKFPGVEPATFDRAQQALAAMKDRGAKFCIALLHAGCVRTNRPDPEEVALMDTLAKSGFDIVAASHSHRISGSKLIAGQRPSPSFCFYGLGSLVSGYIASPFERGGLIVVAGLSPGGDLVRVEVRPVLLGQTGFGEIPSPEIGEAILDGFRRLSDEISGGSYQRLFYQDMSRGLVRLYHHDAHTAFRESGFRGLAHEASLVRMRRVRRLIHKVIG